jgi:hypothetical protein
MALLNSKLGDTKIVLTLCNFQFPDSSDVNDKEWMVGDLNFENRIFKAEILNQPQFYYSELSQFVIAIENLLKNNSGIAKYSGTEPYLSIEIQLNMVGTAVVKGYVWDVDKNSGKLEYVFESDQTCLHSFINELRSELQNV